MFYRQGFITFKRRLFIIMSVLLIIGEFIEPANTQTTLQNEWNQQNKREIQQENERNRVKRERERLQENEEQECFNRRDNSKLYKLWNTSYVTKEYMIGKDYSIWLFHRKQSDVTFNTENKWAYHLSNLPLYVCEYIGKLNEEISNNNQTSAIMIEDNNLIKYIKSKNSQVQQDNTNPVEKIILGYCFEAILPSNSLYLSKGLQENLIKISKRYKKNSKLKSDWQNCHFQGEMKKSPTNP
jgi:hypothetical protein